MVVGVRLTIPTALATGQDRALTRPVLSSVPRLAMGQLPAETP